MTILARTEQRPGPGRLGRPRLRRALKGLLAACLLTSAGLAQKTDVAVLRNGDRMTGEIKSLELGRLRFKTDTMDTVSIKWTEIAQLMSVTSFELELTSGEQIYGSLAAPTRDGVLEVLQGATTRVVELPSVVYIRPIKESFVDRWEGYASVGFSFSKASEVAQTHFSGWVDYNSPGNYFKLSGDAFVTDQRGIQTTRRWSTTAEYQRLFSDRWYAGTLARVEENLQLGVELRTTGGVMLGRALYQSNSSRLAAGLGVAASAEAATAGLSSDVNPEGILSLSYALYRYNVPKRDISASFVAYPTLEGFDRIRYSFNATLRYEIVKDFFWDLQYYTDYDSAPRNSQAESIDFGIVTGFGYSF